MGLLAAATVILVLTTYPVIDGRQPTLMAVVGYVTALALIDLATRVASRVARHRAALRSRAANQLRSRLLYAWASVVFVAAIVATAAALVWAIVDFPNITTGNLYAVADSAVAFLVGLLLSEVGSVFRWASRNNTPDTPQGSTESGEQA